MEVSYLSKVYFKMNKGASFISNQMSSSRSDFALHIFVLNIQVIYFVLVELSENINSMTHVYIRNRQFHNITNLTKKMTQRLEQCTQFA